MKALVPNLSSRIFYKNNNNNNINNNNNNNNNNKNKNHNNSSNNSNNNNNNNKNSDMQVINVFGVSLNTVVMLWNEDTQPGFTSDCSDF